MTHRIDRSCLCYMKATCVVVRVNVEIVVTPEIHAVDIVGQVISRGTTTIASIFRKQLI